MRDLDPGFDGNFFFHDDLPNDAKDPNTGWTPCLGEPAQRIARASAELTAEGPATSVGLRFGRVFNVETRRCSGSESSPP
jgi:hypothetical protein